MDQTETTPATPEVEAADRKELLAQQFEAAERGDDVAPSGRDDKGRFASRATQVEPPATQSEPAEEPVWAKPPASWKKDYHDVWMTADPKMREYAWQREEQMRKGVEPLLSKAQFADAMNQALEPYLEMAENQTLLSEINSFADKAEHFEEARPTMIQLLQSGVAETLEDAYDKAIRLNEDLFNRVQSARQAEVAAKQAQEKNRAAKAARAAAVSVRGSTPGTNTAPKAHSRRALLEEAFDESSARL
jgi:hypothetical protein